MRPLIDGDVILYEIGFASETGWQGEYPPPFSYVEEMLYQRVMQICDTVGGTEPPTFFFTGGSNFRIEIATLKPYKGNRKDKKPFHYLNLKYYIQNMYDWKMAENLEADDLMALEQVNCQNTIICTRDKDLRQVPGWHFSWELANQPQFGPILVEGYGWIKLSEDKKKLVGVGDKFFLSQCITGDAVDNIPGLPKYGPDKAFKILEATTTYQEGLEAVTEAYKGFYGDLWEKMLLEQGRLLWMTREINNGEPVLWQINT